MFYQIKETINDSDEVWRWAHQKYGISRIIRKLYWAKIKNSLTLLLPAMFDQTKETINYGDEVWKWVHQNHGMSQAIIVY